MELEQEGRCTESIYFEGNECIPFLMFSRKKKGNLSKWRNAWNFPEIIEAYEKTIGLVVAFVRGKSIHNFAISAQALSAALVIEESRD